MNNNKGIALIMAIGILAVLAVFGTSFALNMRLEYKAAMNYYHSVKSRYLAEMAAQVAIAKLRDRALRNAFDYAGGVAGSSDDWSAAGYAAPADMSLEPTEQTLVTITDAAGRININNASPQLLNNICDISIDNATAGGMIYTERGTRIFTRKEELKQRVSDYFADEEDYAAIADFITTHSYVDNNTTPAPARSPVNINTALPQVMAAVLKGIESNGTASDGSTLAAAAPINDSFIWDGSSAGVLVDFIIGNRPYTSWGEFNDIIDEARDDGTHGISPQQAEVIKYNCNPNRPKPSTYTAEFCFHSGGVYEAEATGRIYDGADTAANLVSERKINLVAKVFDIYNETTKDQFATGAFERVTHLDTCPVDSDDLFGVYDIPADAEKIAGSLKIGYWHDFEASSETLADCKTRLQEVSSRYVFENPVSDPDPDTELYREWGASPNNYGKYCLTDTWDKFHLRVFQKYMGSAASVQNGGYVLFWGITAGAPVLFVSHCQYQKWGSNIASKEHLPDGSGGYLPGFTQTPDILSPPEVDDISYISEATYFPGGIDISSDGRYAKLIYPARYVRLWPNSTGMDSAYTWDDYSPQPLEYFTALSSSTSDDRVIEIYAPETAGSEKVVTITVRDTSGSVTLSNSAYADNINATSGRIGFYAHDGYPAWDDVRIISDSGTYTKTLTLSETARWGTMTGTLTEPASAGGATLGISFEIDNSGAWVPVSMQIAGGALTGNTLQYRATLTTDDLNETPVLEEITITYLPKVEILAMAEVE